MRVYDKITVRNFIQSVDIGAFQVERRVTQRLSFTVFLEVEPHSGATNDDVDDILSYDLITEAIVYQLSVERLNLLETLAERIAQQVLRPKGARRITLIIDKLDRIDGTLGIEIVRHKSDYCDYSTGDSVGYNSLAVMIPVGPDLTGLDALKEEGRSLLLCFDTQHSSRKNIPSHVSKNLALLDLDQAAWQAAGTTEVGDVVATKTELDWALKNKDVSIWAPFRLLTDADIVDANMETCLRWLQDELGIPHVFLADVAS